MNARTSLLALALLSTACSVPFGAKTRGGPPADLKVSAIIVYPVSFQWSEPPYRAYELSHRMLGVGMGEAGDRALFFGVPEVRVPRPEDDGWSASDALGLMQQVRVPADRALVLRAWVDKRVASARQQRYDAKGRPEGGASAEETTYLGHVELVHPSTRTVFAEVTGNVKVDPFVPHEDDEADPAPDLTRLMEGLTSRALALLEGHWAPPGVPRDLGLGFRVNPKAILDYGDARQSALRLRMAMLDPIEAEVLHTGRVRYANPGMPDGSARRLGKLPGGLYVIALPPDSPLRAGDLILTIAGQPAQPQAYQRARFLTGPIPLKVLRYDGATVDLTLP